MGGNDDDDVILVFEERKLIENINYAVWPGDIKHEERERAKKRKRDNNEDNDNINNNEEEQNEEEVDPIRSLNKRACLSNRYFSSENTVKLMSGEKSTTTSIRTTSITRGTPSTSAAAGGGSGENDDFVRRRDYLMKKLLQSRTLPNLDESAQQMQSSKSVEIPLNILSSDDAKSTSITDFKTSKSLMNTASFNNNDEFIPLRSSSIVDTPSSSSSLSSSHPNNNNDSVHLENVNGCMLRPYPAESIRRVRDHLKYLFSDNSPFALYESNQAQRTFEIVKLKLGLKSKFANDPSVLRRIEREKLAARQLIDDRYKTVEAKLGRAKAFIDLCNTTEEEDNNDDDDDDDVAEDETDEDERDEIMKYIAKEDTINLDDDEDENEGSEDDRTSSSEKNDDDDDAKKDSKYYQYGKYTAKRGETMKKRSGKDVNIRKATTTNNKRSNKANSNDQVDRLELEYNALRRRKVNNLKRKKKRTLSKSEFEMEKKLINADMRKLRKSMRKMKKKIHSKNTTTKNSSNIVSLNSNSMIEKKKKKFKNKKTFFIDNSGFRLSSNNIKNNIKKPKQRFNKFAVLRRHTKNH